jgi:hypothetical protein
MDVVCSEKGMRLLIHPFDHHCILGREGRNSLALLRALGPLSTSPLVCSDANRRETSEDGTGGV